MAISERFSNKKLGCACSFFGNSLCRYYYIKNFKTRSYWISMGPKPNDEHPYKRGEGQKTHRDGQVRVKAGAGARQLQA